MNGYAFNQLTGSDETAKTTILHKLNAYYKEGAIKFEFPCTLSYLKKGLELVDVVYNKDGINERATIRAAMIKGSELYQSTIKATKKETKKESKKATKKETKKATKKATK